MNSREGKTLFMVMLAAFNVLLYRYTGQEEITFGTPVAGRNRSEVEGLIGLFVNTIVMMTDMSGKPTFRELLNRVQETALDAYTHQDIPFEKLVEELAPVRDLSRTPLFQVFFNHLRWEDSHAEMPGLQVEAVGGIERESMFDLTLDVWEHGDDIRLNALYNIDLFDSATIERMLKHYITLLSSAVKNPDQRIAEISVLNAEEENKIIVDWNKTHGEYAKDLSVSRLFEKRAVHTPDAVAILFKSEKLSYGELNRRANQVAHYLRSVGVVPETFVGIYMDRSIEMLIGLIGIMKSGAAYLPLDPAFPADRIGFMIEDSGTSLIITQAHLAPTIGDHEAEVFNLDTEWDQIERFPTTNLAETPLAENLAYLIYTSGSTGLPKGVQISNRALVNFLHSMRETPGIEADDVVLAETTLSFDIAGLELFLPVISGATIALVDKETGYDGVLMQQAIDHYGATVLQATPASWRILLESGWKGSPRLKALCGGEALSQELAAQLLGRCKELWNMYGPTETTIWSMVRRIDKLDGPVLIGRPIANTTIYILDNKLQPVPVGIPGELHIGGDGLARGYLNRPELTEEKFIPSPFSDDPETRIYKTGDLARYRADGQIECLGRLDHQVKIRGFRIELGEIETRLSENEAVSKSVVIAREDTPGDKYLAAYIVPDAGQEISAQQLRKYLQGFLPDYMVPSAFITLDKLPLTPNGKIDRRALPVPEISMQANQVSFEAPRTPMEKTISAVWSEILGVEKIGVNDNFFNLGGHSLLATRVVAKLRASDIALDIPVRTIFEQPTIAELAEWVICQIMATEEEAFLAALLDQVQGNVRPQAGSVK